MKLGILTFHRAISYGAVLQAYALNTFLKEQGYDAEIIDYRNDYFEALYHSKKVNLEEYEQFKNNFGLKQKVKRMIEIIYIPLLRNRFLKFQSCYLKTSPVSKGINSQQIESMKGFDYFIVGSDQVWNLRLTDRDMNYFLKFTDCNRRISFAASIGGYPIEKEKECMELIKEFRAISVRENTTQKKLKEHGIMGVEVHLDPVFLLSKRDWDRVAEKRKAENYILLFEVGRSKELLYLAKKYAKENRKKIFYLSSDAVRTCYLGVHNLYFEDPRDFLSWIKHADYIFTNSFHAVSFSIIFGRAFYCYLPNGRKSNDRMISLLKMFELSDRARPESIGTPMVSVRTDVLAENIERVRDYFKNNIGDI